MKTHFFVQYDNFCKIHCLRSTHADLLTSHTADKSILIKGSWKSDLFLKAVYYSSSDTWKCRVWQLNLFTPKALMQPGGVWFYFAPPPAATHAVEVHFLMCRKTTLLKAERALQSRVNIFSNIS